MRVASAGAGVDAAVRALASQVKPTFMAPAVASSVYGALLAGLTAPAPAILHLLATALALYVAHVRDGYVDAYVREEDESLPLTPAGCRLAVGVASVGFGACLAALAWLVGPLAVPLVGPLWLLGYLHAPWVDRHPVGTSADYAVGVGLVVVGAAHVQAGAVSPLVAGVGAVFVPVVAAGAVLVDVGDLDVDRRLGKRTVAVVLGASAARFVAAGLVAAAAVVVVALVVGGVLAAGGLVAVPLLAVGATGAAAREPARGLLVLMGALAAAASAMLVVTAGFPPL